MIRCTSRIMLFAAAWIFLTLEIVYAQPSPLEISLAVDASEARLRILHITQTIPVQPGEVTLLYPQWIPGEHGPTGPVVDVVNLAIRHDGKPISWRRDRANMYAFHCTVPTGARQITVLFDFVLPTASEGFTSGASSTAQLLLLSWNQVVLYPAGIKPDDIIVAARLRLPQAWKFGTALDVESESAGEVRFKPVSLTMLVDSPVLAGRFFQRVDLGTVAGAAHSIEIAGDADEPIRMPETIAQAYRRLVREALALFGARHYTHYRFLLTLSDNTAHFGLEHHQSSDNRVAERTFTNPDRWLIHAGLLPHEFVHSWNGKYRRPSGLATGDFSTPMNGEMLWVYEGLTQYLGNILTARAGLRTPEQYRDQLALRTAELDNRPGRMWRPLQDAADAAQILYGARQDWSSLRRGVDFYDEGNLMWLEADVIIRQQTKGKKSLDDFCRLFYGGENTGPLVKPYTFDELVEALDAVTPYDWKTFFADRLSSTHARAPMGGIERAGWKVVFRDSLNSMMKALEERDEVCDLRFSIGLLLKNHGEVIDVIPKSVAARAGIAPNMKLIAVNGRAFSKERIRDVLRSSADKSVRIELLVQNVDYFSTTVLEYQGGERYPFLERDGAKPDVLSSIIKPIAAQEGQAPSRR